MISNLAEKKGRLLPFQPGDPFAAASLCGIQEKAAYRIGSDMTSLSGSRSLGADI
jgi:hypothetical protein